MENNSENGTLTAGSNLSCWHDSSLQGIQLPLTKNAETDVVIVGGGIAGITTAYCLACSGKKVIVVEDGFTGSGETGRTTAHITTALDKRYFEMEEIFGKENTALIARSHIAALNFIEATVRKEKIDCGFERLDGYLFLHPSDKKANLQKELDMLKQLGIDGTMLENTPGIPSEKRCIRFPNQAQFHPVKYLKGLCRAIENKDGRIYVKTHATKTDSFGITTEKGFRINAKHIVVATNAPVNDKYAMMLKQVAYRSYATGALIKKNTVDKALWWDTGDRNIHPGNPYHYARLHSHNEEYDLLICGGEDHPVGKNSGISGEERYARLEEWTRQRFPIEKVIYRWSGEVFVPMDSIAYIGRNRFDSDNVYIITGDSGIGMTYCTIGGMLITDLINKVKNPWEEIYKPSRFILKTSTPFFKMLKDDFFSVMQKWFYSDAVELSSVKNDEGKIVILDGKKCGAYRDTNGNLFLVSAECTHLKCMVIWNEDEKSWDCPCHGSRFTHSGKVINGPANEDLPAFSEQGKK